MHAKCWLIQLFLESIKNNRFSIVTKVFPLTLTETLAECPLIQSSFSYSFFFRAEIHKLEKFQKLAICKHKYSQVFKNLPFANISTRKIRFFLAHENKFTQKSVRLS